MDTILEVPKSPSYDEYNHSKSSSLSANKQNQNMNGDADVFDQEMPKIKVRISNNLFQ